MPTGTASIFDTAGNIQFNEVLGGTSNFGNITVRPDPNLERGYNWEYSASVQHELVPRVVGDGRLLPPAVLQPADHRQPERDRQRVESVHDPDADRPTAADLRSPIHDVQPERNKVGTATDNLYTYLDRETDDL